MTAAALPPGGRIGILGGGQLGRMLSLAAAPLGYTCHIFAPEPEPPAGQVAASVTTAAYDDADALARFAAAVDVVTYEFENVPAAAVEQLVQRVSVYPGVAPLQVAQGVASRVTSYFAVRHGRAYAVSCDVEPERAKEFNEVFDRAIASLRTP